MMTILLEPLPSAGPHGRASRLDPPRAHCTPAGILCGVTQPHASEPSCSTASIFRIKASPTARFTGRRPIPRPPFSPWHINARFPALAKSEKATRSPSLSSPPESHCLKPLSCTSRYPPGLRKHLHPINPPMYSHCFFCLMSRGRCQLYAFSSIFGKHSKATADFTPLLLPPVAAFGRGHTMLERPVPVRKSMFRLNYYVLNTHRIHSRLYGLSSRIHHMTLS